MEEPKVSFSERLSDIWSFFLNQIMTIDIVDVIDIAIVAILLYFMYKFIRDRRAGKLAIGVVLLVLLQTVSNIFELNAIKFIMQNVFQVGLLALIVVFQPELRSVLEKVGGEPLKGLKSIGDSKKDQSSLAPTIREICNAVSDLSRDRTGALIVIERGTKLGDVIKSGVIVNADISSFLLKNIFFDKAPMHDGAVIIRADRIHAAGCFLPLSANEDIIRDLGSRHRAGIGMSENSDAIVIIVSEETGTISLALGGQLMRGYNHKSLKSELEKLLSDHSVKKPSYFNLKQHMIPRNPHHKNENKQ